MADELNTPNHRWYEPRNNIKLAANEVSKQFILASGISKIDTFINAQSWGNPVPGLFALAEPGVWYDPSDLTTLFQDSAGTTPVTAAGQSVGKMLDKSGNNFHATQATSTQRPTYGINPITGTRNLLTYTEQFDNAVWNKNNTTVSVDATVAPDGLQTADKLEETAVTGFFGYIRNPTAAFSTIYTLSFYAKSAERNFASVNLSALGMSGTFNLSTGQTTITGGSPVLSAISMGSGWWRCTITATTPPSGLNLLYNVIGTALNANTLSYAGTAGNGIYIWGAQLELGSTATAYQKVVSQYEVTEAGVQSASYLAFDGVDDGMVTNTITPAIDKVQVFAGVRKLSDAAQGMVVETSGNASSSAGSFHLQAPGVSGQASYRFASGGTVRLLLDTPATYPAPITNVVTGLNDIAVSSTTIRVNGVLSINSSASQGTGNYLAYPLYIGRRGGSSLPFNGRFYSLITRFGANLTDSQITSTESWVNAKTGAY